MKRTGNAASTAVPWKCCAERFSRTQPKATQSAPVWQLASSPVSKNTKSAPRVEVSKPLKVHLWNSLLADPVKDSPYWPRGWPCNLVIPCGRVLGAPPNSNYFQWLWDATGISWRNLRWQNVSKPAPSKPVNPTSLRGCGSM
jgi:hypothetical protein